MTASLEQRARHALAHKDIKFIFDDLPAGYRDNPKALRELLIGVVEGHRLASSSAYKEAHAAFPNCRTLAICSIASPPRITTQSCVPNW
jgi:hypothetical protein